jgi:hypothetical protein
MNPTKQKLTARQLAKSWGVSPNKICVWIETGELPAINGATRADSTRPRYLIDRSAIAEFEKRRAVRPTKPTEAQR